MASKPENTFIKGVHKYLPDVYHEKMYNPLRSGTPDVWYSGRGGDMWIEYKYIAKIPVRALIKPDLSARQKDWIQKRAEEGRNVVVIVGCPDGGVIFDNYEGMTPERYRGLLMSRKELAGWIREETRAECLQQSLRPLKRAKTSTKSS